MSNKSDATVHLKVQSQFILILLEENHSAKNFLKTLFVFYSFLYLCGEGVNVQLDKSRLGLLTSVFLCKFYITFKLHEGKL
jgi:hypothetical protein